MLLNLDALVLNTELVNCLQFKQAPPPLPATVAIATHHAYFQLGKPNQILNTQELCFSFSDTDVLITIRSLTFLKQRKCFKNSENLADKIHANTGVLRTDDSPLGRGKTLRKQMTGESDAQRRGP